MQKSYHFHYSAGPVGILIPPHSTSLRVSSIEPFGRDKNRHPVATAIDLPPVTCRLSLLALRLRRPLRTCHPSHSRLAVSPHFPLLKPTRSPIMVSQPWMRQLWRPTGSRDQRIKAGAVMCACQSGTDSLLRMACDRPSTGCHAYACAIGYGCGLFHGVFRVAVAPCAHPPRTWPVGRPWGSSPAYLGFSVVVRMEPSIRHHSLFRAASTDCLIFFF